jgi:hypothetical protein
MLAATRGPRRGPRSRRAPQAWFRPWPLVFGLALAAWLLSRVDLASGARRLAELGALAWLVPLPALVGVGLDVGAWRLLWPASAPRPMFWSLARTRLAMDALALVFPGGWLRRSCRLPPADGFTLLAVRKGLIVAAHALLLIAATVPAAVALSADGCVLAVVWGCGALLVLVAALVLRGLASGRACATFIALLSRLPGPRLQAWRQRREARLNLIDARLRAAAAASPARLLGALALLSASLTAEALETYVILRLLGAPVTLAQALPAEALMQLVRAAAFVVPAGLGIQDAGYALFLGWCGLSDALAVAAAYALARRGREALTAAGGYALLLARARRPTRRRASGMRASPCGSARVASAS